MFNKVADHKLLLKAQALKANLKKRKMQKVSRLHDNSKLVSENNNQQQTEKIK